MDPPHTGRRLPQFVASNCTTVRTPEPSVQTDGTTSTSNRMDPPHTGRRLFQLFRRVKLHDCALLLSRPYKQTERPPPQTGWTLHTQGGGNLNSLAEPSVWFPYQRGRCGLHLKQDGTPTHRRAAPYGFSYTT
ncbi:uncharacterized protein V6R79_023322 [Siganus canaliculatus]